jgi:ketosteroid isomerase-like protein
MNSNADVVRQAYDAFASGDIAGILDLLDERVAWSAPATLPQGGVFSGKDGALRFFQGIGAAWEMLKVDAEAIGELGPDLVVAVVHGAGVLRGAGPGEYGAVHVFTLKGGKITRFREFVDLDGALLPRG